MKRKNNLSLLYGISETFLHCYMSLMTVPSMLKFWIVLCLLVLKIAKILQGNLPSKDFNGNCLQGSQNFPLNELIGDSPITSQKQKYIWNHYAFLLKGKPTVCWESKMFLCCHCLLSSENDGWVSDPMASVLSVTNPKKVCKSEGLTLLWSQCVSTQLHRKYLFQGQTGKTSILRDFRMQNGKLPLLTCF